jgi:hypothetical protein
MEPILDIHQFVKEADDATLIDVFFSDDISDENWESVHAEVLTRGLVTDNLDEVVNEA